MPIEQLTDADLLTAQRELLAKAHRARDEDNLDLAQRYLSLVRPMNYEMARRMRAKA